MKNDPVRQRTTVVRLHMPLFDIICFFVWYTHRTSHKRLYRNIFLFCWFLLENAPAFDILGWNRLILRNIHRSRHTFFERVSYRTERICSAFSHRRAYRLKYTFQIDALNCSALPIFRYYAFCRLLAVRCYCGRYIYFPSQSATCFSALSQSFCAVVPEMANPSRIVAPEQVFRMLLAEKLFFRTTDWKYLSCLSISTTSFIVYFTMKL